MTWQLPDTYHSAGHGRGTATLKFYEGRDILIKANPPPVDTRPLMQVQDLSPTVPLAGSRANYY